MKSLVTGAFIGLLAVTAALGDHMTAWSLMWLLALELYAFGKWISFARCSVAHAGIGHPFYYLFAWVGMDPAPFQKRAPGSFPGETSWAVTGLLNVGLGVALVLCSRLVAPSLWLAQGWMICAGIVLILHFGLFKILAWSWRRRGFGVEPIMENPLKAESISDFWGRRWNRAFRQLVDPFVYAPIKARFGATPAILSTFFLSGIIHDLLISVPARGGYGMPTLYFMLQPMGMFIERRLAFLKPGGVGRRIFTYAVVAGPAILLFHPPFMKAVILPFARSAGIIGEAI